MSDDVKLSWPGEAPFRIHEDGTATGAQKVAQQLLVVLLTAKGSDPTDPEHGTHLAGILQGNHSGAAELAAYAAMSVAEATEWLQAQQRASNRPANERLASAEVVRVALVGQDGVDIEIEVLTAAGEFASLHLPMN